MGTEMVAYIEYDEQYAYRQYTHHVLPKSRQLKSELPPPFAPKNTIRSITLKEGLYTGSKDYLFFGAISGVRNSTNIEPLYPPRGLPSNLSTYVHWGVDYYGFDDKYGVGWLTLEEINTALDHQAVKRDHLSFQTLVILDMMGTLEQRFGVNRVRLIFAFW